ncbi:MAG: hypothetical protein PHO26_09160 [Dehalococcoidia bacterium]|nr:hypothetical protein [Dehalococcoidia bacterium]MDD5495243.1 hypothetical protein [Dehalococcoidia bacterium]
MDIWIESLKKSIEHLQILDEVFSGFIYPEKNEYLRNRQAIRNLNKMFPPPFTDQLYYGDDGRQMILNDIFEYIFSARGYFYMLETPEIEKKKTFLKMVLYFINQLMIFESISVNQPLRNKVLDTLKDKLGNEFFANDTSKRVFDALKQYDGDVHFDTSAGNVVPDNIVQMLGKKESEDALKIFDSYSDSLLPKLPHGLWRELIVYIQLLRINAGYILPLLLNQRILSRTEPPLKPPDFLVIKYNGELVGVEVGGGKETQSSNFSTMFKCQMVTAQNANTPPRCPICGKWIGFCDKVINDYANIENPLYYISEDIRCAHECDIYSFDDVLAGKCAYVKYKGKIDSKTQPKQAIKYSSDYHYHYSCILKNNDEIALQDIDYQKKRFHKKLGNIESVPRRSWINCLKTNYPHFDGFAGLQNYSRDNLACYGKYAGNRNCPLCSFTTDCQRISKIIPLLDSFNEQDKKSILEQIKRMIIGAK